MGKTQLRALAPGCPIPTSFPAPGSTASGISHKTPLIWVLPPPMHSGCKAAPQGPFRALPCL